MQSLSLKKAVVIGLLLALGCSTSNTETWRILSPITDQEFTWQTNADGYPYEGPSVSVNGNCSVGNASNNVAAFSDHNVMLLDKQFSVTSADSSPFNWSGTLVVTELPQGYVEGSWANVFIATGKPKASYDGGTGIEQHVQTQIRVKRPRH